MPAQQRAALTIEPGRQLEHRDPPGSGGWASDGHEMDQAGERS